MLEVNLLTMEDGTVITSLQCCGHEEKDVDRSTMDLLSRKDHVFSQGETLEHFFPVLFNPFD